MKKQGIIVLAFAGMLIFFAAFIIPADRTLSDPPENIPDSVWAFLEKSCYGCHSSDGNGMAKAKLNFDKWDKYSDDKQSSKARAICDELEERKMPPPKFVKNNPDVTPTDVELARVCDWVKQK